MTTTDVDAAGAAPSTSTSESTGPSGSPRSTASSALGATPPRLRVHLAITGHAALILPWLLLPYGPGSAGPPMWVTVLMIVLVAAFHIEVARALVGGRASSQQPHKALSAWAFAAALLLPPPAVLLVVTLTYAHARWRGLRVELWKWVFSGAYLVVAACTAVGVRHLILGPEPLVSGGDENAGLLALVALTAAGAAFLAVECLLFLGSATLNHAEQEHWLREMLRSPAFYLTEGSVIVVGGLLAVLWTAGPWLTLLALPLHVLAARAALLQPMRERASTATLLTQQNEALAEANDFKVQLLSMLGHEVGNPLTTVVGWTQVAAEAVDEGDLAAADAALGTARRGAQRTREVLADITAMVALDAGALTARPQVVLLHPVLTELIPDRQDRPVAIDCDPAAAAWVQSSHLHQIVGNLVSNADKYAGGVTAVRVRTEARSGGADAGNGEGRVRIEIEDAGTVPESVRDRLFTRYARADEHAGVRGTGLGLSIIRDLARANSGDVSYEPAAAGAGSIFRVSLPSA